MSDQLNTIPNLNLEDEARVWYREPRNFSTHPQMLAAFAKHILALSAGTPKPHASLAEGGAGPYTMTENEQGYWRINGPTRVEGEWFRRADAESNLRIVNAAFAAGQASQPPVVDSGLSTKDVVTNGTQGAEEAAAERFPDDRRESVDGYFTDKTYASNLTQKRRTDFIAGAQWRASQPLGEPDGWMNKKGEVMSIADMEHMNRVGRVEQVTFTIPLYRKA